jgi:hypothetical protein
MAAFALYLSNQINLRIIFNSNKSQLQLHTFAALSLLNSGNQAFVLA